LSPSAIGTVASRRATISTISARTRSALLPKSVDPKRDAERMSTRAFSLSPATRIARSS
jgi:hypothetical protein